QQCRNPNAFWSGGQECLAQKVGTVGELAHSSPSYPRKRVSRWGGGCHARWIPAFAGMTSGRSLDFCAKPVRGNSNKWSPRGGLQLRDKSCAQRFRGSSLLSLQPSPALLPRRRDKRTSD